MPSGERSASPGFAPCPWDSSLFGFPVAELCPDRAAPDALERSLLAARERGVQLAYWRVDPAVMVSEELLRKFHGRLVDRKVTYRRTLSAAVSPREASATNSPSPRIAEYPARPASPELVQLALDAGEYSRFNVDPRLPKALFRALYGAWIERSTRREAADTVLVAYDAGERTIGMVTASANAATGTIGLIAVSQAARGRGVGRALMAAAEDWMAGRAVTEAQVTTQQANAAACSLYERCGYRMVHLTAVYHFWPREPENEKCKM